VGWFESDKISPTCSNVTRRGGANERATVVCGFHMSVKFAVCYQVIYTGKVSLQGYNLIKFMHVRCHGNWLCCVVVWWLIKMSNTGTYEEYAITSGIKFMK